MNRKIITALTITGGLLLTGCAAGDDVVDDIADGAEDVADGAEDAIDDAADEMDEAMASVSFGGVEDGATVTSPLTVSFEADGFEIVPANEGDEGTGHMHVMIDVGCVAVGEEIPSDETHVHFGDGSTTADLELTPGEHTLCLQAGDATHHALDITDEITVTVE